MLDGTKISKVTATVSGKWFLIEIGNLFGNNGIQFWGVRGGGPKLAVRL